MSSELPKLRGVPNDIFRPFSWLPNEIISEILMICWNLYPLLSEDRVTLPRTTSLVCKHWQQVTLTTPALWSSLCFYSLENVHPSKVGLCLERSRISAIDVQFVEHRSVALPKGGRKPNARLQQERIKGQVKALFPHRMRLWRLTIKLPFPLCFFIFDHLMDIGGECEPSATKTPLPSLTAISHIRHLSMDYAGRGPIPTQLSPIYAPFLKEFDFNLVPPFTFGTPLSLDENSGCLTKLVLGKSGWNADTPRLFASVLTQNTRLQILSISYVSIPELDDATMPVIKPVSLPLLGYLRLCCLLAKEVSIILPSFHAPNLEDFVVDDVRWPWRSQPIPNMFNSVKRVSSKQSSTTGIYISRGPIVHLTIVGYFGQELKALFNILGDPLPTVVTVPPHLQFPLLRTITTRYTDLALSIKILREQPLAIAVTFQIYSVDLVDPKVLQEDADWLKQNYHVEIWGQKFSQKYLSVKPWLEEWCQGLRWVADSEIWDGSIPQIG